MNNNNDMIFETVIGLEVHLQFGTKTKIFCGCANEFGKAPNTSVCPVCLGLPGSLPVLNQTALHYAIKVALALNCKINSYIQFDRKNYYYPDLPKGYQISQFKYPIGHDGFIMIPTEKGPKKICIHRAHLEEDAGKLIHNAQDNTSLVNYNRCGTPLMEIVTDPDMRSPQEAYDYLQTLKLNLSYLNVSDCDMEKGSLRCDANISIRPKGRRALGVKAELKNMNSFKAVKAALTYEVKRQQKMILKGQKILQETRLWNEDKAITLTMRGKEEAHDYRYFPEPDLVPFTVDQDVIAQIQESLPESPQNKFERFQNDLGLNSYDAGVMIQEAAIADFFEKCVSLYPQAKKVCNWISGPLLQGIHEGKIPYDQLTLSAKSFTDIIQKVDNGDISNLTGKDILKDMLTSGKTADEIIKEKGLSQVSDDDILMNIVDEVLKENETVVQQIKDGKTGAIGFLIGSAMKKSKGKANPKKLNELIHRRISHD